MAQRENRQTQSAPVQPVQPDTAQPVATERDDAASTGVHADVDTPATAQPGVVSAALAAVATAFNGFRGAVVFSPPGAPKPGAKPKSALTVAYFELVGCFGALPIVSSGWALAAGQTELIVYAPSGGNGYYKHVSPRMVPIPDSVRLFDQRTGARLTTMPDPAGMDSLLDLQNAIRAAWLAANAVPGRTAWNAEIPIEVAAR